jgi:Ca2+-binding RTX toxin-like protein
VGTPSPDSLVGTPDADVIVGLGGPDTITGLGGDDTICPGGGADTVDAGAGRDLIEAGGGADQIAGGPDEDVVFVFGPTALMTLDGGTGTDIFAYPGSFAAAVPDQIVVDVPTGQARFDQTNVVFDGFEFYSVDGAGTAAVAMFGGPAADNLRISDAASVRLGGGPGDDVLDADLVDVPAGATTSVAGGLGQDSVSLDLPVSDYRFDLGTGQATRGGVRIGTVFAESLTAIINNAVLGQPGGSIGVRGTEGPDQVLIGARTMDVKTLGGDDTVIVARPTPYQIRVDGGAGDDELFGRDRADTFDGGPGDDRLVGAGGDDTLRGGTGTDRAEGGAGVDTCVAETEVACEN